MRRFLHDMKQKRRNLTVEVTSISTMLESVIEHWKCYTQNVRLFQPWLEEAEKVLHRGDQAAKMVNCFLIKVIWSYFQLSLPRQLPNKISQSTSEVP